MKRLRLRHAVPLLLLPLAFLLLVAAIDATESTEAPPRHTVKTGVFEQWVPLAGRLEPANPTSLRAELTGLSKLTWIIEDGTPVEQGEPVARFDPSELEDRKINLTRDLRLAEAELRALTEARHPMELARLRQELEEARGEHAREHALIEDTRELLKADLISEGEVTRQSERAERLKAKTDALQRSLDLTRTVLHPAQKEMATARVAAAKEELRRIEERLEHTVVRAPISGIATLPYVPLDGERRQVRIGDGLYRNQVFLEMADLTRLVVKSEIGERDLSRVTPGQRAVVHLPAFPDTTYRATVTDVAARPRGERRRYPVELTLDTPATRLRPGLSTEIEILVDRRENALLLPRGWVDHTPGGPEARVQTPGGAWERRSLRLGPGNAAMYVVDAGLKEGEVVRKP